MIKINSSRKFNLLMLVLLFSALGFNSLHLKAQTGSNTIIQSPYYDAISIYYAMMNYKAYPVVMRDDELAAEDMIASTKKYKIIESSTGKIILDNCKKDSIQTVLTDYQFLADAERRTFIYEILARNAQADNPDTSFLKTLYKKNLYLNKEGDSSFAILFNPSKSLTSSNEFIQPAPFSFSGGNVTSTQIFEGIAEFLIDAVNKEINDALFIHLKEALSKYDELRILFPKTLESLDKIEITKYVSSLNGIKSAFQEDIKNILSNVSKLAALEKYQRIIDAHPALTLVFTACDIIANLKNDNIPADILYQISIAPYITNCTNNYSSAIKLAALISNSLRNIRINDENKNTIGWIDQSSLNSLKKDAILFRIFMGLIAQNAGGIIFSVDNKEYKLQDTLFKECDKVLKSQFIVYNFSQTAEKIKLDFQGIKNLKGISSKKSDLLQQYLILAKDIIGLSENCLDILPSEKTIVIRNKIKSIKQEYLPLFMQANTVLAKIEENEYSMAVYEADTLLQQIFANNAKTENKSFKEIRDYYLKYGLFISSIASAKNAEDVKEAIKAFALPTGSSRIKKEHHFTLGLNAYVGVFHAWNKKYDNVKLPDKEFGITAPIGFAVNWGHFLCGSLTAYGGIIDVGAIFTYKVNTDSSIKSDIQLGQLLSPSIGLIYGLPIIKKYNIPLSIGVNYQWGPKLRKVDDKGNSVLPLLTQRINVLIAVDIPIVNFHVSKK